MFNFPFSQKTFNELRLNVSLEVGVTHHSYVTIPQVIGHSYMKFSFVKINC